MQPYLAGMKVAAYQAPMLSARRMDALEQIGARVAECEAEGVSVLCCPEAILGGLADYGDPREFAVDTGRLEAVLAPIASDVVTTIVGFTELSEGGRLYNSAAVFQRGVVTGVYRKLHPALRRSVYDAGRDAPVFLVGGLTFGIVICNDSNFPEPAGLVAAQGAKVLFVPTNNGLPPAKASANLPAEARKVDVATAVRHRMWVVRADVAGLTGDLVSWGSSSIVNPAGSIIQSARVLTEDLIVAEIAHLQHPVGSGTRR